MVSMTAEKKCDTEGMPLQRRVLHVVLSMEVGGAEKLVYDMVRHQSLVDRPPAVCCLDTVGELGVKLREEGIPVHCKGRRPGLDFSVIPWLAGVMRQERATVVHAHQYTPLFYTVPAALLAGALPVVYTEHGRFYPDRRSFKRALFTPLLSLGVDHLVAISAQTAKAMADNDNLPLGRIKVVHNGVDLCRMTPPVDLQAKRLELGLSPDCRIIGTAARLNEIKNIPMMLRVFKRVLQTVPNCCLVIAGTGNEEVRLKALAAELGISSRVKFIGLRFDLPEVYRLFEVFLLTSFTEGISVTLLEAMASGVPSVVTDVGGNGEVVLEGQTGYLVSLESEELMAQRVVFLLENQEQAADFASCSRDRVQKHFSFEEMMHTYRQMWFGGAA